MSVVINISKTYYKPIQTYSKLFASGASEKENLALSIDRAFSVMEYLLNNGIEKDRLRFKGYGETNPKVPNNSTKSRAINRRTDFLIF